MIEVKNLWKSFRIFHEREPSTLFHGLKGVFNPRRYEEFWALQDINFHVSEGEFFGVIGENGSGKTTLLKLIAKVLNPTKGSIVARGRVVPFLELGLGFHDESSGRENAMLYGQLLGISKSEMKKNMDELIEFSGLEQFIDAKLNTYSSGMRVRLAFSTAIQTNPDILLVDEVLAVGDLKFQRKCFDVFREFKDNKRTILFVSHDLNAVKKFCDRAMLLQQGKQVALDEPGYIIDKYFYSTFQEPSFSEGREALKGKSVDFRKKNNMPDFERIEDLKKIVGVRWGTREIEITQVDLFDKFGKKTSVFATGDSLKIRIHYKKHKDVKNPVFGIGVFYKDGGHCFGTNTEVENYSMPGLRERGFIECVIPRLSMWGGDFYLNVMVHDAHHYHYDWHNKMYMFKVIKANNHEQGLYNLECKWKLSK
ncbi:MAG TPA: ABC transporter ATP-binding protein [Candidatus Nanoarchaeia archaeon]|nr:ABC transporter ATP-binding protein [Candidatus Nanoarchaeia archaeon]